MSSSNTIALLSDIKNRSKKWNISVRVVKKWDTKSLMKEKGVSVDFMLMDREGTCIHAKAISKYSEKFRKYIEEGRTYEIVNCAALQVSFGTKATSHDFMLFLNPETVAKEVDDDKSIAKHKQFDFVNLQKIPDYNGTTQLIDVIGVISSWKPLRATENSLVREIMIKDQSGRDATLMLWDNLAREFDITKLSNKNVLILTSANVATLRGRRESCVMSKAWSSLYIDLDIEQVQQLRDSTPEIDIGQLPKNNDILHWKDANRKTLADVTTQFGKDGIEVLFTCKGKVTKYISLYEYLAHKQCHCKVDEVNGSFYCKKHGPVTKYYQSGNVKLEIADESGRQVVALFNKQIEALIGMDMEIIVEYNQSNIQIGDLFEEAIENDYVFELKVKNIGEMTMTMTKFMKIEKKAEEQTITEQEEKDTNKRKRQEEEDEEANCSNGKAK